MINQHHSSEQFLAPIDPNAEPIRHELANLVMRGQGPSEDALVAPEPIVTGQDVARIVAASEAIPDIDAQYRPVTGSRIHSGNGPHGEGPSLSTIKARQNPVDPFSLGVRHAAEVRRQARRLS